ncbi:MAG: branched-chain amino acid ABC transporter permease [Clostridia bacterium]|nr:branched-chain amino acid ABC transporter permease [Clostridia bacterium]
MKKFNKTFINNAITYALVIAAFIIMTVLMEAGMLTRSMKGQLVPICVYIVMAVSLNLTVGISGELSLGHAGFMSVGAFTGAVAAACLANVVPNDTLRLILSMIVGGVIAAIAGVIIGVPVLRLRGDYLAIVTLAFGEIIRNVINCLYIALDGSRLVFGFNTPLTQAVDRTAAGIPFQIIINGPQGATINGKLSTFTMGFVLVMVSLVVVLNLVNSRSGRAIMAIRDNRIAAESVGISATKYKMMAFVISATLAGMAGALYSLNYSSVTASKFKFDTSILVLVFVVLGGIGNIRGSVIAAALLTILPELLRAFNDYRMLIYAIVLILVMLVSNNARFKQLSESLVDKIRGKKSEEGGAEG